MNKFNFTYFAASMVAFMVLFSGVSRAQSTITLPQACNCPSGTNPSTNGTGIVSAYGGPGCTGSGTINGSMTQGVAVSGVTMTLFANVTQLGSWSLSSTNNGVTFTGSGTFTALGCQSITLTGAGTPTASGPFTWNTNSTPAGSGTATVAATFNPSGITAGAGSLSGRTCFDIALSNNDINSCGPLTARTATQANFTLPAIHTQTYTFTPSTAVSNVRFYYINDVGNAVIAITGGNAGNNISTAQTATVNYNTNNNTLALGLTNTNPMATRIFAVYNINPTNNNNPADDRILALTANVKDCQCCGAPTSSGGFLDFMCHNLGADYTADPFTPSWRLNGAYFQWGKKPVDTNGDGYTTKLNSGSEGFAAAPTGPTAGEANASVASWSTSPAANGAWNVNEATPVKTANDPCPAGYRVPTRNEWVSIYSTTPINTQTNWSNVGGATWTNSSINYNTGKNVNNTLYLPASGNRTDSLGTLADRGNDGRYWSSTEFSTNAYALAFTSSFVGPTGGYSRLSGFSVRCVAE